jgi:hypothetical protein
MAVLRQKRPFHIAHSAVLARACFGLYADLRPVTTGKSAFRLVYRNGPQSADGILEAAINARLQNIFCTYWSLLNDH